MEWWSTQSGLWRHADTENPHRHVCMLHTKHDTLGLNTYPSIFLFSWPAWLPLSFSFFFLPPPLLSKHRAGAEFTVQHEGLSAHQGKFPCLSGALSSINPVINTANTHTHTHVHISPTNREVSLEEAAAVAGVTAVLKSETLVPVNSNLALRLPLSHSV